MAVQNVQSGASSVIPIPDGEIGTLFGRTAAETYRPARSPDRQPKVLSPTAMRRRIIESLEAQGYSLRASRTEPVSRQNPHPSSSRFSSFSVGGNRPSVLTIPTPRESSRGIGQVSQPMRRQGGDLREPSRWKWG